MRFNPRAVLRPLCWLDSHSLGFIRFPNIREGGDGSGRMTYRVEFGCRRCRKQLDIDDYHRDEVLAAMERRKMREEQYRERNK